MLSIYKNYIFILLLLMLAFLSAAAIAANKPPPSLVFKKLEMVEVKDITLEEAKEFIRELKALAVTEKSVTNLAYYPPVPLKPQHIYSDLEKRIAQEVIATGQMLGGDPRFEDVVSILLARGKLLFSNEGNITQNWIRDNLQEILPNINNPIVRAALDAATGEVARGAGSIVSGLSERNFSPFSGMKLMVLRSGLEAVRAAASKSDITALNRMELEYSLSGEGVDEISLLTVQPIYDSESLRHNIFVQGSYANKAGRSTANLGIVYRYITSDAKHMFGGNIFFDHQWPYHHNRMSFGMDYKTSLYGVNLNHYIGLSDWRKRRDGYEEKSLSGTDIEFSGRLPQVPELEVFARGFNWKQGRSLVFNTGGNDIWGYELAAEYTPINILTLRSSATKDNEMDDFEGKVSLRLNYKFGEEYENLFKRPSYNLDSVLERRFDKVRRQNDVRVQVRQAMNATAQVTFAQGGNVSVGQSIVFGKIVTTGGLPGDGVTVVFGNGAVLDIGQNTQVQIDYDLITLTAGIIQFTSASGSITNLAVPGGTIQLLGTDVDLRVAGGITTFRVRDGAADFTDETGTTRVNIEELVEMHRGDSLPPILRGQGTAIYKSHVAAAHEQLDLIGPSPNNPKAAPFVNKEVSILGDISVDDSISFSVPLTKIVNITGAPQLKFTLGGLNRLATYVSGSGTKMLVFTYTFVVADETLSTVIVKSIKKNGGTLLGVDGAQMVLQVSGGRSGTVPGTTVTPIITSITAVESGSDPANIGDVITITIFGSQFLVQSGFPTLTLDIGGATKTALFSVMNAGNAEFTYTVQTGDNDFDGISISAINFAANEIEDAGGNDLDTTSTLPHNLSIGVLTSLLGLDVCPDGNLSAPANSACARLFGIDPLDTDDVMVYAGDVPGTNKDFFVRRCDLGQAWTGAACTGTVSLRRWKNNKTLSTTKIVKDKARITVTGARNGEQNTTRLVNDNSGTHAAAEGCAALSGSGWYLPGISELDVVYATLVSTDDPEHPLPKVNHGSDNINNGTIGPLRASFNTTGIYYWSSSEKNTGRAWMQRFSDGDQSAPVKTKKRVVRCARR